MCVTDIIEDIKYITCLAIKHLLQVTRSMSQPLATTLIFKTFRQCRHCYSMFASIDFELISSPTSGSWSLSNSLRNMVLQCANHISIAQRTCVRVKFICDNCSVCYRNKSFLKLSLLVWTRTGLSGSSKIQRRLALMRTSGFG